MPCKMSAEQLQFLRDMHVSYRNTERMLVWLQVSCMKHEMVCEYFMNKFMQQDA